MVPLLKHGSERACVLVVEDDPVSARLLAILLREAGYDVRIAADAEVALAMVAAFRPALAVVDLLLPGMSGIALAERVHGEEATRTLPLVAVTSLDGPEVQRIARRVGYARCLTKPIDASLLATVVAEQLQ